MSLSKHAFKERRTLSIKTCWWLIIARPAQGGWKLLPGTASCRSFLVLYRLPEEYSLHHRWRIKNDVWPGTLLNSSRKGALGWTLITLETFLGLHMVGREGAGLHGAAARAQSRTSRAQGSGAHPRAVEPELWDNLKTHVHLLHFFCLLPAPFLPFLHVEFHIPEQGSWS